MELKKEAEFFGDINVVPYLDSYDLVVLKTVAIFEHGVSFLANSYDSSLFENFFFIFVCRLISYLSNT